MPFHAILVSKDEEAIAILTPILLRFGVETQDCDYSEAPSLLKERGFDAVIVDFDDLQGAGEALHACADASADGKKTISIALLSDKSRLRQVFGEGANFVLYKPISQEHAEAGLRAATALIKRERRGSFRVPVQIPAKVQFEGGPEVESIILDLSEDGMDMLSEQSAKFGTKMKAKFALPGEHSTEEYCGEAAWTNKNGQCGVRFIDLPEELRAGLKNWVQAHATELPPDPDPVAQSKLTDLTLGGCYVETESPFPEKSGVVLCLTASGMEVRVKGMVQVMHPNFGMGIEFAARTPEQRQEVNDFIKFLTSQPGMIPELLVSPGPLYADVSMDMADENDEIEDPLLDLLRHQHDLSQEQFLRELARQRNSYEEVASS
jgi:CheY-like chemotaxis protein